MGRWGAGEWGSEEVVRNGARWRGGHSVSELEVRKTGQRREAGLIGGAWRWSLDATSMVKQKLAAAEDGPEEVFDGFTSLVGGSAVEELGELGSLVGGRVAR